MKHLYKITILLLLALLLPDITFASSQLSPKKIFNRDLHDLSGTLTIAIIQGESQIYHNYTEGANVTYSGDEDVTMTARLYGHSSVIDSIHGNEMYVYLGNINGYNNLVVTVHADGYNDLVKSVWFLTDYMPKHLNYYEVFSSDDYLSNVFANPSELYAYYTYYDSDMDFSHGYELVSKFRTYTGDITIPSSATVIGNYAFNVIEGYYPGHTTITLSFPYMPSFPTAVLTIPSTIVTIEQDAFRDVGNEGWPYEFYMVKIEDLASWCAINFNGSDCNPLCHTCYFSIEGTQIKDLVIPSTISSISSYAFASCPGVNSVTLPVSAIYGNQVFLGSSVQSLMLTGEGSFQGGSLGMTAANIYIEAGINEIEGIRVKPTNVYCFNNTPPICNENTFTDYSGTLHVPAAALAAYFTAPYWSNFHNIVGDAVEPQKVTLNKDSITLPPGSELQLFPTITPINSTPGTVIWNSTNNNVATVENGHVIAINQGECDIIASCVGKQAICHVIVKEVKPIEIILNQDNAHMGTGTQLTLTATVLPDSTTYNTVTWLSSNESIATVDNGVVTSVHEGECDIIAQCQDVYAVCHLVVSDILPISITLDKERLVLETSMQSTLSATILPDSTTYKIVEWSSTDENVAIVNNGVVTAVHSGECDIIAKCQNVQAICHVIVTDVLPTTILLSHNNIFMTLDTHQALFTTFSPESSTYKTVTWSTSDNNIATVDSDGVVTALGIGECDIIAQCAQIQAVCHVTVSQYMLDQHEAQLLPNHIISLTPTFSPIYTNITVTSSDPSVAAGRYVNGVIQVVGINEGISTLFIGISDNHCILDSCIVEVYTERGDVNCDGFVNISDVTTLIDVLLGGEAPHSDENADCNADNRITISDVTALIDALLSGEPLPDKDSQVYNVNGVSFKMVKVKGGTFMMGATAGQGNQAYDDEFPVHEVILSSYCIGETEVTQALWQAVMGENPSNFKGDLNRPVEMVSWYDCQTFVAKLNQMTGKSFRLPSEAEWEFAARGGNLSHDYMYAGSNNLDEVAWAYSNIPSQQPNTEGYGTQPVAQKMPNELGLYDMSGNVYEWCNDWFDIYSSSVQLDPTGPGDDMDCHYRVNRGGGWNRYGRSCRVSLRNNPTPESAAFNYGLRLAM